MIVEQAEQTQSPKLLSRKRVIVLALLLVAGTSIAYAPALRGGFIWDDPDYVVNNLALRSARGLWVMWTSIYSLPQWYPMVHTTYWLEYRFFGLNPLVFKIDNLILHIATALLLWRLLWRLEVSGAYLAALIFAVHPVHVESVAWITERKNTLSGFFYVAAFLAYLRSGMGVVSGTSEKAAFSTTDNLQPTTHNARWYWVAFALFLSALLSKTVTASFPAAMLVVIWWKTGRVRWADVKPLLPFFAAGIAMGVLTAYLERHHVGAYGVEWDYAPTWYGELAARTLIAGHALWFYAGKLIWPHPLAFMYERWTIDPTDWRQWLYPVGAVLVLIIAVLSRRRLGRGPLVAILLFGGTLIPALGYFNVFPHRYSFVADHFQHLASIALTTLFSAAIILAISRISNRGTAMWVRGAVTGLIGLTLCALSFNQSRVYQSALTLWLDTAEKSPKSWVAFTNLGKIYKDIASESESTRQREQAIEESVRFHEKALELDPNVGDTWFNIGTIYATQGRWDQAVDAFNRARELSAQNRKTTAVYLDSTVALGRIAFVHRGDRAAAEKYFLEALAQRPDYTPALVYAGVFYEEVGRIDEAFAKYLAAIEADPNNYDARYNLGNILMTVGKYREAAEQFSIAVANRPTSAEAWANFGWAQLQLGQRADAVQFFNRALMINPQLEQARKGLQRATTQP